MFAGVLSYNGMYLHTCDSTPANSLHIWHFVIFHIFESQIPQVDTRYKDGMSLYHIFWNTFLLCISTFDICILDLRNAVFYDSDVYPRFFWSSKREKVSFTFFSSFSRFKVVERFSEIRLFNICLDDLEKWPHLVLPQIRSQRPSKFECIYI